MRKKKDEIKKVRTIRLTDKVWRDFLGVKNRDDKSWDLFLAELLDAIKYIKKL